MPTYDFRCVYGHEFEHRCSISDKPDELPCPVEIANVDEVSERTCDAPARQVFLTAPLAWIPGVTHQRVFDYPGSKAQKAGHVHTHGDKPATKVQSGYGGMTSTGPKHQSEIANWVKPDRSKGTMPGG